MFDFIHTSKKKSDKSFKTLSKILARGQAVTLSQGKAFARSKILLSNKDEILFDDIGRDIRRFSINSKMVVSGNSELSPWQFITDSMEYIEESNDRYLKCKFPSSIEHTNQRDNHRVTIPIRHPIKLKFVLNGKYVLADIVDLSSSGARIEFSGIAGSDFIQDQIISAAYIECEYSPMSNIDFIVKWANESGDRIYAGIHFHDLKSKDIKALTKTIYTLEREILKKRVY